VKKRPDIISITTLEASRVTGIPKRTLEQHAKDGRAPGRKIGKRWVWPLADLRRWIEDAPTMYQQQQQGMGN
jgi:excisionase family DNA binding protein